jgi:hypothetical protein
LRVLLLIAVIRAAALAYIVASPLKFEVVALVLKSAAVANYIIAAVAIFIECPHYASFPLIAIRQPEPFRHNNLKGVTKQMGHPNGSRGGPIIAVKEKTR